MLTTTVLFRLRLFFFTVASVLNVTFVVLLMHRTVAHSDICWWLFALETVGLSYYSIVEFWLNRFSEGRLSVLGIMGSAVATQGILSNSMDPTISRILLLLAGCNLGFIFSIGLRIRSNEAPTSSKNSVSNGLTKDALDAHTGVSASTEILPEEEPVEELEWESHSETSSEDESVASDRTAFYVSQDLFSLGLGIMGLLVGICGWVLNFSAWIKECLDKDTCSDLGPQWWTLGQSLLFFIMYILATTLSRTFEVLAAYSVLVSIPLSIFLRVANTARSDVFFLKNQESAYETWNSVGTVIGSSLIAASGALLVMSLGVLNFSWKTPAPERTRSMRATLSLVGLLGVVIFGIGLHSVQDDLCNRKDPLCDWYDGLWVEISLEIVIVIFGILSVFGQPGESVRAMLIALAVLPSFTYIINISRFLNLWNSDDEMQSSDTQWEIRFSASGLILLFIVNYMWIFAWGWGKSECLEAKRVVKRNKGGVTRTLLKSVTSITLDGKKSTQLHDAPEELEMGQINGHASL